VRATALGAPRPIPGRGLSVLAGAGVLVLALPIFLVADWPLAGWVVAAVVWVGVQGLGLLLTRIKPSADNLAASSVLAFGMMGRLLGVLVVLVAVTASNHTVGLAAAVLYGLAYTAELAVSLATYYVQEPRA
jgi:hypothetical protein